jgi:hypothetical protein
LVWAWRLGAGRVNRGKVLVHSRNEQTMAHFLPSWYKVY